MNIYSLGNLTGCGYDQNHGLIVSADTEQEARKFANEVCADEGEIWEDNTTASCRLIGVAVEGETPGIYMTEHHAG